MTNSFKKDTIILDTSAVFLNPGPGHPPALHILCVFLIKHTWFNLWAH